jgi:hypothetical protein
MKSRRVLLFGAIICLLTGLILLGYFLPRQADATPISGRGSVCLGMERAKGGPPLSGPRFLGNRLQNLANFGPARNADCFVSQASDSQSEVAAGKSLQSLFGGDIQTVSSTDPWKDCSTTWIQGNIFTFSAGKGCRENRTYAGFIREVGNFDNGESNYFICVKCWPFSEVFKAEKKFGRARWWISPHFIIIWRDDFSRREPRALIVPHNLQLSLQGCGPLGCFIPSVISKNDESECKSSDEIMWKMVRILDGWLHPTTKFEEWGGQLFSLQPLVAACLALDLLVVELMALALCFWSSAFWDFGCRIY